MERVKIILADSQYLIRLGLRHLLERNDRIEVLGECGNAKDMMTQVTDLNPDLVILDYQNSGHFNVEDIRELKHISPNTRIMVISSDSNKENIHKVLEYGVLSYLTKECDEDEITSAVIAVSKNQKFFCNKILDILLEKHLPKEEENCQPTELTTRELEVVKLIVDGIATPEIADKLNLSPHTVYTHRKNLMKKLKINSTSELVRYAITTGLVDPI